jgi:hypothetical protein
MPSFSRITAGMTVWPLDVTLDVMRFALMR